MNRITNLQITKVLTLTSDLGLRPVWVNKKVPIALRRFPSLSIAKFNWLSESCGSVGAAPGTSVFCRRCRKSRVRSQADKGNAVVDTYYTAENCDVMPRRIV